MKITSSRGLFGAVMAISMIAGGPLNAMAKSSRNMVRGAAKRAAGVTEADRQRIEAAQAKRERRAARNRKNGLTQ